MGYANTGRLEEKISEKALYRLAYISRALPHLVLINELGIGAEVQRRAVREIWGFS
jgi:hypothetical protein